MTPQQIQASLSTLTRLQALGEVQDVSRICGRLLALYPAQGPRPESVVEDWCRKLVPYPVASIWCAYDRHIEQPGPFAPSLGDFLAKVKSHAKRVESVKKMLKDAIANEEGET